MLMEVYILIDVYVGMYMKLYGGVCVGDCVHDKPPSGFMSPMNCTKACDDLGPDCFGVVIQEDMGFCLPLKNCKQLTRAPEGLRFMSLLKGKLQVYT